MNKKSITVVLFLLASLGLTNIIVYAADLKTTPQLLKQPPVNTSTTDKLKQNTGSIGTTKNTTTKKSIKNSLTNSGDSKSDPDYKRYPLENTMIQSQSIKKKPPAVKRLDTKTLSPSYPGIKQPKTSPKTKSLKNTSKPSIGTYQNTTQQKTFKPVQTIGTPRPEVPNVIGKPVIDRRGITPSPYQADLGASSPQNRLSREQQAFTFDLGIEYVRFSARVDATKIREGDRVPVTVRVRNYHGHATPVIVTTTGDTSVRQIFNKSAPISIAHEGVEIVPLHIYINPQQVRSGVFRTHVWLGSPREALVYRDTNLNNNKFVLNFRVLERQTGPTIIQPPRPGDGMTRTSPDDCDESKVGTACQVQPPGCTGRGMDWKVSGKKQCVRGELKCVADKGTDYCNQCGGNCGGCTNDSCSVANQCAPGSICVDNPALFPRPTCKNLNDDAVARHYGRRVCTHISGFCWTPDEVGMEQIICNESL